MGETENAPVDDFWAFLDMPDEGEEELKAAYRNGDPLRVIAGIQGSDTSALVRSVAPLVEDSDELERCRSVRRRSVAAAVALRSQEELVTRLTASGIDRPDIPMILKALGTQLDTAMAVELLCIPSRPMDVPGEPRRLGDKLSLLYVAGKHHGVEPDYQLALGKMSLDAVAVLRRLFHPDVPYRHLAEILAVIEPTARAVRTRMITALGYRDYQETALKITRELGMITKDTADPWPVPASNLRHRFGRGFWEDALNSVGLALSSAEARFGSEDYFQALDDFSEECMGFDYSMNIETYDRWVVAGSARGSDRPSAVEMIRHYGSWEAVVEIILGSQDEESRRDGERTYIDYDSGWGTMEELAEWEAREFEEWRVVGKLVGQVIEALPSGSFLHLEYGGTANGTAAPYARAKPGPNEVTCEIVSNLGFSPHSWRLSTDWLTDNGWSAPGPKNPNWLKAGVPRTEAAAEILRAIQLGRVPVEATELRWSVGRIPDGPGPSGGVTITQVLQGVVQTLLNAEL